MTARSLLPMLCLLFALVPAAGADLDRGIEAYNSGDYATALREFQTRAEAGDDQAQLLLGLMHDNGLGTPKDPVRAYGWYRKAAESGNPRAQFNIAEMLSAGQGVAPDRDEALRWYARAADNGYPEAQYKYGLALAQGEGIAVDRIEGWKWLDLAAGSGVEGSEAAAQARDALAARMSADELRAARERSQRWRETVERKRNEPRIEI